MSGPPPAASTSPGSAAASPVIPLACAPAVATPTEVTLKASRPAATTFSALVSPVARRAGIRLTAHTATAAMAAHTPNSTHRRPSGTGPDVHPATAFDTGP